MSQMDPKAMWEERYAGPDYVYGTDPNSFLLAVVEQLAPCKVLCIAEGEGRNAVYLASLGHQVTSVELTESGVAKTLALAKERGQVVDARQGDLATCDFGQNQWDLVVSIFAHTPRAVRIAVHERVVRALKPGGKFVLEAYTPDQIARDTGGPKDFDLTMDLERLREELAPLVFDHAVELVRPVVEGPLHSGEGAVVQIIARKP